MEMKIALGTDHAVYVLEEAIKSHLISKGMQVIDFGTDSEASVDYPDYIRPAAESVSSGIADLAIVFGGSGNGEAMCSETHSLLKQYR